MMNTHKMPKPEKGNVVVKGYVDIPSYRYVAVTKAMEKHIGLTRAEEGCIYFSVTPDHADPKRLNVAEIFKDRKAFDHHQRRTGASAWAEITKAIERHFDIVDVK